MARPKRLWRGVIVVAACATLALPLAAQAAPDGVDGTATAVAVSSGGVTFNGACKAAHYSAGIDNGGAISYRAVGVGTAVSTQASNPVVSTDVGCRVYQGGTLISAWSGWTPGSAAATTGAASSASGANITVCIDIFALTQHGGSVPQSSGWTGVNC